MMVECLLGGERLTGRLTVLAPVGAEMPVFTDAANATAQRVGLVAQVKQALSRRPWFVAWAILAAMVLTLAPTVAAASAPAPPTLLSATPGASPPLIATLAWTASTDSSVVGYRVLVADIPGGDYALLGQTVGTSFQVNTGIGGRPYYFQVVMFW